MKLRITAMAKTIGRLSFFIFLFSITASAQVKYQNPSAKISIEGTSNLHDWVMNSEKSNCSGTFTVGANNAITAVTGVNFSIVVETLKSEHKAMDKNTYKAMNTDKYPGITFVAASSSIKPAGSDSYTVTAHGKLTIASVTKEVDVIATCKVNSDNSINCTGSFKFKMTEYKVTPPSIMFGMIKVGDGITFKFNFNLKP
jgi:polyisoprenoid-binding protein YceI